MSIARSRFNVPVHHHVAVRLWVMLTVLLISTLTHGAEVGAIGHLEPASRVLYLGGPGGSRVESVGVSVFDEVREGQVLMTFDNQIELQRQSALAEHELQQVQHSAPLTLRIQQLAVQGASAQLQRSQGELDSYQQLAPSARSGKELLRRQRAVEDAQREVKIQELKLQQLKADNAMALERAKTQVEASHRALEHSTLRAPSNGVILELHKHRGDPVGNDPLLVMADVSTMNVVCDVYEGDLLKLKTGMPARISSSALPQDLRGQVRSIGRIVNTANRLGKVTVTVDDNPWAARLIGMEVHVAIQVQ